MGGNKFPEHKFEAPTIYRKYLKGELEEITVGEGRRLVDLLIERISKGDKRVEEQLRFVCDLFVHNRDEAYKEIGKVEEKNNPDLERILVALGKIFAGEDPDEEERRELLKIIES